MQSKSHLTRYKVNKMDCSAEEQMVRMQLSNVGEINKLEFDLSNRVVSVFHSGSNETITGLLDDLNLDSELIESKSGVDFREFKLNEPNQYKLLLAVLIINLAFFIIEMTTGLLSGSMGLVADSLDMFADAAVYGMSLMVVGKALSSKKLVAKLAGYFQFTLAVIGFFEVVRRFFYVNEIPDFQTMIIVSILALAANLASLFILQKTKSEEAHVQASKIFTSNDIIVNGGVIAAGILVNLLNSKIPDLAVGAIVFSFIIKGSFRILKLAK